MVCEKGLAHMLNHADNLEAQLEQHPPDQEPVILHLTVDVVLSSSSWERWPPAIPLPVD